MQGNPYGAVPEALKETRLTLRDLMTAHLENKVAEGHLGLEKAKADTELAMVGANIKRDEIASLRDAARDQENAWRFAQEMQRRKDEFGVNTNLRQQELSQQEAAERNRNAVAQGHLGIDQKRWNQQAKEYAEQNADVNLREFLARKHNLTPSFMDAYGVPDVTMKVKDAVKYTYDHKKFLDENAAAKADAIMKYNIDQHGRILDELGKPGIDPNKKQQLIAQGTKLKEVIEAGHSLVMSGKKPDPLKVIEAAGKDYDRIVENNPAYATKVSRDEHVQKFTKSLEEYRTQVQTNREDLNLRWEKFQAAGGSNYDAKMTQALSVIKQHDDPKHAAQVEAGVIQRNKDPGEALKYAEGWAAQILRGKKAQQQTKETAVPDDRFIF